MLISLANLKADIKVSKSEMSVPEGTDLQAEPGPLEKGRQVSQRW